MKRKNKYLIYGMREEIIHPDGKVKNIKINLHPVVTDDVDKFKEQFLLNLQKVEAYKDCKIYLYLSYSELENEFLS